MPTAMQGYQRGQLVKILVYDNQGFISATKRGFVSIPMNKY